MPCTHCTSHRISTAAKAVTFGAAAGLMLGMLFAKRSGKELRKDLSKAGEKGGLKGAAELLGAELKLVGKDVVETSREAAQSDTVQDAVKKGRTIVRQVKDKLEDEGE